MKKGFWTTVKDIIRKADIILEILDARMPEITRNRKLEEYGAGFGKPFILVINKADLISDTARRNIKDAYREQNCVWVSATHSKGIRELVTMIKNKIKRAPIKVAFIGYPNTGKSSLINQLSKGGRARTSPESGLTRGIQLIGGKGGLMLMDTPGVVPFEDRDEIRLGLVSGISPAKLRDPDLVAYKLIEMFQKTNPAVLERTYGIDPKQEPEEILIAYGRKLNMLQKGSIVDEQRAAIHFLMDWHSGKIRL